MISKAEKMLLKPKEILKTIDEFMVDKEYYGQEQFKKYLHPFKDYLITGKGKHIDFKIFDFAAESIKGPESKISISELSQRSINNIESLQQLLRPQDNEFQVPEESYINN